MKIRKRLHLLKLGIILFGISLLLWNCEKDEIISLENQSNIQFQDKSFIELSYEPDFEQAYTFFEKHQESLNRKATTSSLYNFTIDSSSIKVIKQKNYTSYTFFCKKSRKRLPFF